MLQIRVDVVFGTVIYSVRGDVMTRVLFIMICLFGAICPVRAEIVCNEDCFGHKKCSGTNQFGEFLQTDSYKNMSGTIYTVGRVGTEEINLKTEFNPLGEPKTSGRLGSTDVGADMFFDARYGHGIRRVPPEVYTDIGRSSGKAGGVFVPEDVSPVPFSKTARPAVLKKTASRLAGKTVPEDVYAPHVRYAAPAVLREHGTRSFGIDVYERRSAQDDNEYIRRPRCQY